MSSNIKRAHFIDELRGILIIYIVWYHLMFDLTEIYGATINWVYSDAMEYVRITAVCALIIISGISCNYSASNIKRGIKTFLWGMVITAVTFIAMPQQIIIFGILHFMGSAMIIIGLIIKQLNKIPALAGIIISLMLFYITYNIYYGYLQIFGYVYYLPQFFYDKYIMFFLGFKYSGAFSADYYPLLPWIFMYFSGVFFGRLIKHNKVPKFFYNLHYLPLAKTGQHTLFIYLIHQPLLIAILFVIFKLYNNIG